MRYKQPITTGKIKTVILKAVSQYLNDQMPENGVVFGYQDNALAMANETYEEFIDSGATITAAKVAAKSRFFEELESLVGDSLVDGISGCFEKYKD